MAQRNFHRNRGVKTDRPPIVVNVNPASRPKFVPQQYGKPFIVMEDEKRQTFIFEAGAWVAYGRSIAECRSEQCLVKQLAQKVNNMTRYEISLPI